MSNHALVGWELGIILYLFGGLLDQLLKYIERMGDIVTAYATVRHGA